MDTYHTTFGLALTGSSTSLTPREWNARYEAMSFEHDWWFKAGVAVSRWVRSSIAPAFAATATPVPSAAHA
jgi:hypothetical protein